MQAQSDNRSDNKSDNRKLSIALGALAIMIVGLMALGAGVRAMNAGLACPDWPLCFGKAIPDFHVGVYFEFIHRAYAGLVALVFLGCVAWILRARGVPAAAKRLAVAGVAVLALQIAMGGLTVLKLLKTIVVTSHLMLATLFFSCVLWMLLLIQPRSRTESEDDAPAAPLGFRLAVAAYPILVLAQMALGGLVAASYAGSVCVDFPLCNGEWAPTFAGPIGLQVLHRFGAYLVVALAWTIAGVALALRARPWATPLLVRASETLGIVAFAQLCIGVANLVLYIPPAMTVLHQTGAVATLAAAYRLAYVCWRRAPADDAVEAPSAAALAPL